MLSFRQATMLIHKREGMQGFMRGFNAAMVKNFSTAGTYFSFLFYIETQLKRSGLLSDSKL